MYICFMKLNNDIDSLLQLIDMIFFMMTYISVTTWTQCICTLMIRHTCEMSTIQQLNEPGTMTTITIAHTY